MILKSQNHKTRKTIGNTEFLQKTTFHRTFRERSFWSRIRESNPPSRLGKPLYYRYTNPACSIDWGHYSRGKRKIQPIFVDQILRFPFMGNASQEICAAVLAMPTVWNDFQRKYRHSDRCQFLAVWEGAVQENMYTPISCFPPDKLGLKVQFCAKFWVEFPFGICYDIVVSIWAERLGRYTAKSQF